MLIWGSKPVKRTLATGEFGCPNCRAITTYRHVQARKHGHVYWIPLFPVGQPVEYVECTKCRGAWDPAILQNQRPTATELAERLAAALLAGSIAVASASGHLNAMKKTAIVSVVEAVTGRTFDRAFLDEPAPASGLSDLEIATTLLYELRDQIGSEEKEAFIQGLAMVALSDGAISEAEGRVIQRLAEAVGVTPSHTRGILLGLAEDLAARDAAYHHEGAGQAGRTAHHPGS